MYINTPIIAWEDKTSIELNLNITHPPRSVTAFNLTSPPLNTLGVEIKGLF